MITCPCCDSTYAGDYSCWHCDEAYRQLLERLREEDRQVMTWVEVMIEAAGNKRHKWRRAWEVR